MTSRARRSGLLGVLLLSLALPGCGLPWASTVPNHERTLLLIMSGTASQEGTTFGREIALALTLGDAQAIERECGETVTSSPVVRARTQVVRGDRTWVPLYIYGTTPQFLEVRDRELEQGRVWTEQEGKSSAEVCVLGRKVAHELFGEESPLGKTVRVNQCSLKVIGTLRPRGANLMGLDQDDLVLAPWTTIKGKVIAAPASPDKQGAADEPLSPPPAPFASIDQILVRVRSEEEIPEAVGQITELLRQRHRIGPGEPDDFSIRDPMEMNRMLADTEALVRWVKRAALVAGVVFTAVLAAGTVLVLRRRARRAA